MWTLATKRPSHAFLPSDMFSHHSQYDKQARTRQARGEAKRLDAGRALA